MLTFTTSNPPIIKERRPYRKRKITEILPTTSSTTAEPSAEARLKKYNREWYHRNCMQLQPAKHTTTSTLIVPVPHQPSPEELTTNLPLTNTINPILRINKRKIDVDVSITDYFKKTKPNHDEKPP